MCHNNKPTNKREQVKKREKIVFKQKTVKKTHFLPNLFFYILPMALRPACYLLNFLLYCTHLCIISWVAQNVNIWSWFRVGFREITKKLRCTEEIFHESTYRSRCSTSIFHDSNPSEPLINRPQSISNYFSILPRYSISPRGQQILHSKSAF